MKIILSIALLILFRTVNAQDVTSTDSTLKITDANKQSVTYNTDINDRIYDSAIDNRPHNKYGNLLNDDPLYNPRSSVLGTAARVAMVNLFSWSTSRYLFHYEWAKISTTTWKNNLHAKVTWDDDRFGTNFIGHPHTGNLYFNVARSNGYSYWKSLPFAVGGSLMWEYFGENSPPSRNDLINTPLSGMFLGEVLYRISSNILDDRARGGKRILREIIAGIIDPPRALNRLTQGKMFRVINKEVYQKEPLNITLSAGVHMVNVNNKFATGPTSAIINLQLDYGDPFEVRKRKPFDVFRLRTETRIGEETKFLDNVIGYGLLFGKNIITGKNAMLIGGFQYFDYWNNKVFEMGSLGFGVGLISKISLTKNSKLYSSIHLAGVPVAANNTRFGPDTSLFRDYKFGGGLEAKIEETLNLGRYASVGFNGYYYWIHNYENLPGKNIVGILKPRLTINISKNISVGAEHHIYYVTSYLDKATSVYLKRTEQKFFVQIFLEDMGRKGRYH